MNRVYLLGAGASRDLKMRFTTLKYNSGTATRETNELNESGPLSSGYFYYANNLIERINQNLSNTGASPIKIQDNLFNIIDDYYQNKYSQHITKKDLLKNESISKQINIEELYIWIESEIDKIDEPNRQLANKRFLSLYCGLGNGLRNGLPEYIHETLSIMCYYCNSEYHRCFANYITNTGGDIISFNWDILLEQAMFET
ncbi:MAG: hypothetical protein V1749_09920, partial [Candidatus Desantisbacteria bacterium]